MDGQITVRKNEKFNGLEVQFPAKPPQDIIDMLKQKGMRWNRKDKCWYRAYDAEIEQELVERFV